MLTVDGFGLCAGSLVWVVGHDDAYGMSVKAFAEHPGPAAQASFILSHF